MSLYLYDVLHLKDSTNSWQIIIQKKASNKPLTQSELNLSTVHECVVAYGSEI